MAANIVTFAGSAGDDAMKKTSVAGKAYASFRICHTEKRGDLEPIHTWINAVAFGGWADYAGTIKKGDNVTVVGSLSTSSKKRVDGTFDNFVSIVVTQHMVVTPKKPAIEAQEKEPPAAKKVPSTFSEFDHIPF